MRGSLGLWRVCRGFREKSVLNRCLILLVFLLVPLDVSKAQVGDDNVEKTVQQWAVPTTREDVAALKAKIQKKINSWEKEGGDKEILSVLKAQVEVLSKIDEQWLQKASVLGKKESLEKDIKNAKNELTAKRNEKARDYSQDYAAKRIDASALEDEKKKILLESDEITGKTPQANSDLEAAKNKKA